MAMLAVQSVRMVNGWLKFSAIERGVFATVIHHDMAHAAEELRHGRTVNIEVNGDSLRRLIEYTGAREG